MHAIADAWKQARPTRQMLADADRGGEAAQKQAQDKEGTDSKVLLRCAQTLTVPSCNTIRVVCCQVVCAKGTDPVPEAGTSLWGPSQMRLYYQHDFNVCCVCCIVSYCMQGRLQHCACNDVLPAGPRPGRTGQRQGRRWTWAR